MSSRRAWQALGWFWGVLLVLAFGGAGVLQMFAPKIMPPSQAVAGPKPAAAHPPVRMASAPPPVVATAAGPASWIIAPPDPALLEPSEAFPSLVLPRKGADGRQPMTAYARPFDPTDRRPRIALLVDGIGLSQTDSAAAMAALPGAVSFAISPYAVEPDPLLGVMRASGHEFLISIPLEPQGYPLNDEGARALLTGAPPERNAQNLQWALTRIQGYVGVTGGLDGLRGERYAAVTDMLAALEEDVAVRGLLYIDPRPGAPSPANAAGRAVDLVVDDPPLRADIEAKLTKLEQMATDRGAAVGLAGPPRPVTLERIAAWANGLSGRGFVLVPISALAQPAAGVGVAKAGPMESAPR